MPFKKNRASRDDNSQKSHKPATSRQGSFSKSRSKSDRPEGSNSPERKLFSAPAGRGFSKPSNRGFADEKQGEKRSFNNERSFGEKRTFKKESSFGSDDKRSERKPYGDKPQGGSKPYGTRSFGSDKRQGAKPYGSRRSSEGQDFPARSFGDKPQAERKSFGSGNKSFGERGSSAGKFNDKPFKSRYKDDKQPYPRERFAGEDAGKWRSDDRKRGTDHPKKSSAKDDGLIRLNRYIANAGICSRRKADDLIMAGVVTVNGEAVSELGFKVDPAKDLIRYNGETLKREKPVYVLLNKPKDYITTTDDPQERKTVMNLVEKASKERIYPVGRLDRNTTGLLLMTNDGDLAEKLSHPRNNVTKIYQAELNRSLTQGDLNKIAFGLELEDGFIKPDQVSYVTGGSKREVGIQIHSGKNRIVRRIFEHLGYEVVKLDRVVYSSLTKKDLPRGRWRYLEEKEVIQLKHLIK